MGFDKTTFAKMIGANYNYITDWEAGKHKPQLYYAKLLSDILNKLEREAYPIEKVRIGKNNIVDADDLILQVDVTKILKLNRKKLQDSLKKFNLWHKKLGVFFMFSRKEVQELADKRAEAFTIMAANGGAVSRYDGRSL